MSALLAFQEQNKTFIQPTFSTMVSVYGFLTGILKSAGLSMLDHTTRPDELYIEAVAVNESVRGKGIGTQLLNTLFQMAEEKRYRIITLQVIDTNPKAKSLYERLGFSVTKSYPLGPLSGIIGWTFNEVYLMEKNLAAP